MAILFCNIFWGGWNLKNAFSAIFLQCRVQHFHSMSSAFAFGLQRRGIKLHLQTLLISLIFAFVFANITPIGLIGVMHCSAAYECFTNQSQFLNSQFASSYPSPPLKKYLFLQITSSTRSTVSAAISAALIRHRLCSGLEMQCLISSRAYVVNRKKLTGKNPLWLQFCFIWRDVQEAFCTLI